MAADPFTLPASDPSRSTFVVYKFFRGYYLDARLQDGQYPRYRERFEAWQHCCPESIDQVEAFAPARQPQAPQPSVRLWWRL